VAGSRKLLTFYEQSRISSLVAELSCTGPGRLTDRYAWPAAVAKLQRFVV